jgi:hypothetical protein
MKTIDIKGKKYIEVNERLKYFRENYKGYSLESEIISLDSGVCVFKAIIKDEKGTVIATGHAYEKEGSSFINSTSYIENCETSAWGRALGNLGIGIDTSIASAEEVLNAQLNQKKQPAKVTPIKKEVMEDSDIDIIAGLSGVADVKNLEIYFKQNKDKVKDLQAFINACASRKEAING